MVTELQLLKRKRDKLLKKAGVRNARTSTLKQQYAEKKKLQSEIFALKHPESARAKSAFKSAFKGFSKAAKAKSGLILRNAERMGNKMRAEARENERLARLERIEKLKLVRKRGVKKKVKKTIKRKTRKKYKSPDYGF